MQIKEKQVIILSAVILLITCIFSQGYHHLDEHFQILEFAALKLDLTVPENLPWEYHFQMRPSVQPAIAVVVYKTLGLVGIDSPFSVSLFLRLLSAGLSLMGMWFLYRVFSKEITHPILKKWLLLFSFLLWFLVYNSVRFSSENWSGGFFVLAFSYYFLTQKKRFLQFLVLGIFLGFTFLFRYQAAFLVVGFLAWLTFIKREKISNLLFSVFGILLIIGMGFLCDYWFYGEWTIAMWNYFELNLLQDKVSVFGVESWWFYLNEFTIKTIPPFSLLFLAALPIVFYFEKKSALTWCLFPFLLIHFLIGHKELRFLFPIIFSLPYVLIKSIEIIQEKVLPNLMANKGFRFFMKGFFLVNFAALIFISFYPADNRISLYKTIYNKYEGDATLYFSAENPYDRATGINFYKRKNLTILNSDSSGTATFRDNKTTLFVFNQKPKNSDFAAKHELIYTSFPDWIKIFNFNGWVERSDSWYVYELRANY